MITELCLTNFRCFEQHTIPLKPITVIVGRNNVGKSTVVEALRLIAIVGSRYRTLPGVDHPRWLQATGYDKVVKPSLRMMGMNLEAIFHRYGHPPALATCTLDSGQAISAYVDRERELYGVIKHGGGQRSPRMRSDPPAGIRILAQVGPVAPEERVLSPDYVRSAVSSPLSPLHFRNQLHGADPDMFERFRDLAESSWPGLRIRTVRVQRKDDEESEILRLYVQDGDFVGDIAVMGHGLQMWLQVMWFLVRCQEAESVILDEPDVYMHADLQRKLVRMLRDRHTQTIIATHSVEILSEVEPEHVLVLDRGQPASRFAVSLPGVQQLIDQMGGVHNLQVARLWASRKVLLLEGQDLGILKRLHTTLHRASSVPLDSIPNIAIGGWNGWEHWTGSGLLLRNAAGKTIRTYCILDRDYHPDEAVRQRMDEARARGVQLHVWRRKELENYLLVPVAISRALAREVRKDGKSPDGDTIKRAIQEIAPRFKESVFDAAASEHYALDKRGGMSSANKAARRMVERAFSSWERMLDVLPGKSLLAELGKWSQRGYGVGVSALKIARELKPDEIPQEMREVLAAIEAGRPFAG